MQEKLNPVHGRFMHKAARFWLANLVNIWFKLLSTITGKIPMLYNTFLDIVYSEWMYKKESPLKIVFENIYFWHFFVLNSTVLYYL